MKREKPDILRIRHHERVIIESKKQKEPSLLFFVLLKQVIE